MKIDWSPEAAADFAGIVAYIRGQNPCARLIDSVTSVSSYESFTGAYQTAAMNRTSVSSASND